MRKCRTLPSGMPNVRLKIDAGAAMIVAVWSRRDRRREIAAATLRLIDLARAAGFCIETPEADEERGGSVIIDAP